MTTHTGPQAQEAGLAELLSLIPTNWCDSLLTGPDAVINGPTYDGQDIERLLLAIRKRIEAFVPPARVVSDSLVRDVAIAMHASENKTSGWAWEDCSPIEIEGWLELAQAAIAALSTLQSGAEGKDHSLCKFSTGICGSTTAGTGKLDDNGYWEFPCELCALKLDLKCANEKYRIAEDNYNHQKEMHRAANERAEGLAAAVKELRGYEYRRGDLIHQGDLAAENRCKCAKCIEARADTALQPGQGTKNG